MTKGFKKHSIYSEKFNVLETVANLIKNYFDVKNFYYGGFWNGMEFNQFYFYCSEKDFEAIKKIAKKNNVKIL